MSDPRPRLCDETPVPAWTLPRYGIRAALRAWALAIVLGCALYACATHAHGQALTHVAPALAPQNPSHRPVTNPVALGQRRDAFPCVMPKTGFADIGLGQLRVRATLSARGATANYRPPRVGPVFPAHDAPYRSSIKPVVFRDCALRFAPGVPFPDQDHRGIINKGRRVAHPRHVPEPSLGDHIGGVIRIRAKPEMARPDTRTIVARMTNMKTASVGASLHDPGQTMGDSSLSREREPAVPALVNVSSPLPAIAVRAEAGSLINPAPELLPEILNRFGVNGDIIRSHREPPTLGAAGRDVSASPAIAMDSDTANHSTIRLSEGLYSADGNLICHATPMANGAYSAAHCGYARPVFADGSRPDSSADPVRDLMHYACCADPAVVIRTPNSGEAVEWRNSRGVGGGTVRAVWWARGRGIQGGDVNSTPGPGVDWYPVLVMCHDHGRRVIHGDSGSGAYAAADGALVAIVIRASLDDWTDHAGPCDGAQWVIGVMVP